MTSFAPDLSKISEPGFDPAPLTRRLAQKLTGEYANLGARQLVDKTINEVFGERITLVSSFGSGSAVLLHMVAQANTRTPVLFVDTGKHFGETLRYRDQLIDQLGLQNVSNLKPLDGDISIHDPQGILWSQNADTCCAMRKVAPLNSALQNFDAWFTGRRREQNDLRQILPRIEVADGRIKINALANWTSEMVDDYFREFKLPRHPLEADGYLSIGCMTCTERVAAGEDPRAGRWRGREKTECGIHLVDTECCQL
jgi:phosphoadenosine phosphosulfate reductase